ncbi:hypothetical protein ACFL5P_01525 [candidate division KSB1 bacterium]
MNFPESHPVWMWLYFGVFGSAGAVLFTLIIWNWMKLNRLTAGFQRSAAKWNIVGYMLLFTAQWFACGIGGTPGRLLSSDPANHYYYGAVLAAILAMFFSVPGWICVFIGQRKLLHEILIEYTN